MSVTITQAQATAAQARLGALETTVTGHAAANAAILAKLSPLAAAIAATQHGTLTAVAALSPLRTSIIGSQHGTVTSLAVLSRLPPLQSAATASMRQTLAAVGRLSLKTSAGLTAAQHLAAVSWLGPLHSSVRVQGTNVNTVVVTVTLPPLHGSASTTAHASLQAVGLLHMAVQGTSGAEQSLHATSRLKLGGIGATTAASTARITATLGPLATSITAGPPPVGYAVDGSYYAALPARPFYASLPARPFYAQLEARSFYALSNPNVTPILDTLDPTEKVVATLDATPDLGAGETLTSITKITAVQQSGPGGSALPTLSGQLINSQPVTFTLNGKTITVAAGCAVQVVVTGGVSGCHYLIAATCSTSNPDKVLTPKAILPVSSN